MRFFCNHFLLSWLLLFRLAPWSHATLEIIRPILDHTVPIGANVTFEVRYQSDAPVTLQWRHETNILSETSSILTLTNIQPHDIGRYAVILSSGSSKLTNSAILDIDVPYPSPRFISAEPILLPDPPPFEPLYDVAGTFKNGTAVARQTMVHWFPANEWRVTFTGFNPSSGSLVWSGPKWGSFYSLPRIVTRMISDTEFLFGYGDFGCIDGFFIGPSAQFQIISSSGATNLSFNASYWASDFCVDEARNIHLYTHYASGICYFMDWPFTKTELGRATIIGTNGVILSKTMPSGFSTAGNFFSGRRGDTNFLPEINYTPHSTNAWVFGALRLSGELDWVSELELIPGDFIFPLAAGLSLENAMLAQTTYKLGKLSKVLRSGEIAWSIAYPSPYNALELKPYVFRSGHVTAFATLEEDVTIGSSFLPATAEYPFVFVRIDRAGVVRCAARLFCRGLDTAYLRAISFGTRFQEFTFESPGKFRTSMRLNAAAQVGDIVINAPTNRFYAVRMDVPDPDPTPAKPPFTRAVSQFDSITLHASPDIPGMVLYQWFRNGQPIPGATEHDLTIRSFQAADAGQYSVAIRNAYGSAINPIATLEYREAAALTIERQPFFDALVLRWPLSASNYRLEQTADLDLPFSPVTATLTTNNSTARIELLLPMSATQSYFRLYSLE